GMPLEHCCFLQTKMTCLWIKDRRGSGCHSRPGADLAAQWALKTPHSSTATKPIEGLTSRHRRQRHLAFESSRQRRLTPLQEVTDRRIAFKTDRDLVGATGFAMCASLRQQFRACSPVRLVFGEPHISR